MAQYLLKASAEEFDSWRAEVRRLGGEKASLAPWIRRVLNAQVAAGDVRAVLTDTALAVEPYPASGHSGSPPHVTTSFKPDFKGVKR